MCLSSTPPMKDCPIFSSRRLCLDYRLSRLQSVEILKSLLTRTTAYLFQREILMRSQMPSPVCLARKIYANACQHAHKSLQNDFQPKRCFRRLPHCCDQYESPHDQRGSEYSQRKE